jgi:hypothetical protein
MIGKAGTGKGFSGLQSYLTQDRHSSQTTTKSNRIIASL